MYHSEMKMALPSNVIFHCADYILLDLGITTNTCRCVYK